MTLHFATRGSALARWQTNHIIQRIQTIWPEIECSQQIITTQGDRILDQPLPEIGGKGIFTDELESSVLSGESNVAVHSLKDMPVEENPGLVVAAIPARDSAFDVLVSPSGYTLKTLPQGARVGTCSVRRAAQLLATRADITILPLRGNVDTRLQKVTGGGYDAIVLASAGLSRLSLDSHITETFPLHVMLPAPGQGALAVQCRADDLETRKILSALHDPATAASVHAERAFLSGLGGGCSLPIGAFAELADEKIILTGIVIAKDGRRAIRLSAVDTDPHQLGERLAKIAIERGAKELLT
jgi:hydroxymethylbilane synthase